MEIERSFSNRALNAKVCFLWSPTFKHLMDENYLEGSDTVRPEIYRDMLGFLGGSIAYRVTLRRLMLED